MDATFFAPHDDTRLATKLREVTVDGDAGYRHRTARNRRHGKWSVPIRAVVNLDGRYRFTTAQIAATTKERFSEDNGSESITMSHKHEEVRDYTLTNARTTYTS